jgi:flap endonuclease-1
LPDIPYQEIRNIFLNPEVPKVNDIQFNEVNYTSILDFLCIEKSFSENRVTGALEKLKKSIAIRNQSLEKWFG